MTKTELPDELFAEEDPDRGALIFQLSVTEDAAGLRADQALLRLFERSGEEALRILSRSQTAKLIEEGAVLLDGVPLPDKKTPLKAKGEVTLRLPPPVPADPQPENIPLDVVYEDEDIIVINKPKGMVVHPAPGHTAGTLVSALLYHCGDSLSGIGGVLRPGIVHRIDRDTTGLIAVAKNDRAHLSLSAQLSDHSMHREYRALVQGGIREGGTVNAPLGRSQKDRKKMAVHRPGSPGARKATTHYEPMRQYGTVTELRLILETGRTHQIRVHMSHIGHPLLGDEVYGGGHTAFEKKHAHLLVGQALHAEKLILTHPRTGETVTFTAPPPPEYQRLLAILEAEN